MSDKLQPLPGGRFWYDVPQGERHELSRDFAPINEMGEHCPYPWDPEDVPRDVPLGQYHCPYCGAMVVAGVRHPDWRDVNFDDALGNAADTL